MGTTRFFFSASSFTLFFQSCFNLCLGLRSFDRATAFLSAGPALISRGLEWLCSCFRRRGASPIDCAESTNRGRGFACRPTRGGRRRNDP